MRLHDGPDARTEPKTGRPIVDLIHGIIDTVSGAVRAVDRIEARSRVAPGRRRRRTRGSSSASPAGPRAPRASPDEAPVAETDAVKGSGDEDQFGGFAFEGDARNAVALEALARLKNRCSYNIESRTEEI